MIYPVSMPTMPTRERVVRKGEVVTLLLDTMSWPRFEHGGSYYAVATFSRASCNGTTVRFTTKKRWFRVGIHASRDL